MLQLSGANTFTGATTVAGGTLRLLGNLTASSSVSVTGGNLQLASNGTSQRVIVAPSLSVTGGAIDLTDNKLIVRSTPAGSWNGSSYTGATGLIASGRNGGDWSGSGIKTSAAGGGDYRTLGIATAAQVKELSGSATDTFAGQTVHAGDTLVMYTYGGDANLDGVINIDDYTQIDSSVAAGGSAKGWFNGDFNYDGNVDIDDYTIIDSNFPVQGPPIATGTSAGSSAVTVSEPTIVSAFAIAAAAALRRAALAPPPHHVTPPQRPAGQLWAALTKPPSGVEPETAGLQNRCSAN